MLYNAWRHLILALRRRKGISQSAAAARAGVDESTWSRWEKGEVSPRPCHLEAIAQALERCPQRLGLEYSRLLYRHYGGHPDLSTEGRRDKERDGESSVADGERSNPCSV